MYPRDLVPAFRQNDYVRLEPSGDVYIVDVMVAQPGVRIFQTDESNGVSPGANNTDSDNEATNLELPEGWLGQYRPVHLGQDLQDDVRMTIDLGGQQAPIYTNKNVRGEIEDETPTEISDDGTGTSVQSDSFNTHLAELYVFEDEVPFFTFEETGGGTPTISDIRYSGFQYRLESANSVPNGVHVESVPTQRVRE